MNRKFSYLALASVILMLGAIFNPSPAVAQTGAISVAEFREKFTAYAIWLDNNASPNQNLAEQIQMMTDEEFQVLYDSFADPDAFATLIDQVMTPMPMAQSQLMPVSPFLVPQNVPSSVVLATPAYPSGSLYDLRILPVRLFGALQDWNNSGSWNDDRCSDDGETLLATIADSAEQAAIWADATCKGDSEPISKAIACAAAGALQITHFAAKTMVDECSTQGDGVNSAEIEAVYENSRIISSQVSTHDTEIKDILAANHAEVMDTLARNQAQLLKIEIEKELSVVSDNKRLSYFYLPEAQGGLLELVRETVLDTITENQAAGMSIGNAQSWFAKADVSFAKGNYKAAFDQYKKAYLEAVK